MQHQYERIKTAGCTELQLTHLTLFAPWSCMKVAFRRKLERSFQAVFLPLVATHESVLDRALRRQRPFLQNKDGYRDTLIWLSIKTRITEHAGEYLFVTNNSKDFSDKELVAELGNLGQGTSLRFENDLKGFINNHAKDALERLNTVRTKLQRALQLPGIDLKEALSDPGSDVLRSMSNKLRLKGYQYRKIEEPYHIDDFSEPEDIQVDEVFRAQDDVIVECSVQYPCAITGYVYHAEAISDNEFFEVTDWNWNEHYAEVQFSATVETKILVRLSEERLEPDEAPVDEVPGGHVAEARVEYSVESIEVIEANVSDE